MYFKKRKRIFIAILLVVIGYLRKGIRKKLGKIHKIEEVLRVNYRKRMLKRKMHRREW